MDNLPLPPASDKSQYEYIENLDLFDTKFEYLKWNGYGKSQWQLILKLIIGSCVFRSGKTLVHGCVCIL